MRPENLAYRLLKTTMLLNNTHNEQVILQEILKAIRYVMNAEASSLLLLDGNTQELYFHLIEGGKAGVKEIRLKMGEGIAGWVAKHGEPLMVNNVKKDKHFTKRVDRTTGFITRNILCACLKAEDKTFGVIEAINKRHGRFVAQDLRFFSAFAAQAAIAINNARLYSLAFTDSLTGAHGRRYFDFALDKELARAQRYGNDFSLAIIDIDHFKAINDKFSHLAGDFALAETAKIMRGSIRKSDLLARYGGEEFGLILPHTPKTQAGILAERIRFNVERHSYVFAQQPLHVTVSIGLASYRTFYPKTPADLILAADQALYQAKHLGRNRAVIA